MIDWYALALFSQAAFGFSTYRDPMDDQETFIAQIGAEKGPALSIECGALTGQRTMIRVRPGRQMLSPLFPSMDYYERVRFDDRPAIKIGFRYVGNEVLASGWNAQVFLREMRSAARVTFELSDWQNTQFTMTVPLTGAVDSVEKVKQACSKHG